MLIKFHKFWWPKRDCLLYKRRRPTAADYILTQIVLYTMSVTLYYKTIYLYYREILLYFNIPFPGNNHIKLIKQNINNKIHRRNWISFIGHKFIIKYIIIYSIIIYCYLVTIVPMLCCRTNYFDNWIIKGKTYTH